MCSFNVLILLKLSNYSLFCATCSVRMLSLNLFVSGLQKMQFVISLLLNAKQQYTKCILVELLLDSNTLQCNLEICLVIFVGKLDSDYRFTASSSFGVANSFESFFRDDTSLVALQILLE